MADMMILGYGCTNGIEAQKWLNSADGCNKRKCRQLLGLFLEVVHDLLLW